MIKVENKLADKKEIILNRLKGLYIGQSSNDLEGDLKEDILSQIDLEFEFIDIQFNGEDFLYLITDEGEFVFIIDYIGDGMGNFFQYEISDIELYE